MKTDKLSKKFLKCQVPKTIHLTIHYNESNSKVINVGLKNHKIRDDDLLYELIIGKHN